MCKPHTIIGQHFNTIIDRQITQHNLHVQEYIFSEIQFKEFGMFVVIHIQTNILLFYIFQRI